MFGDQKLRAVLYNAVFFDDFRCGESDHIARNCPQKSNSASNMKCYTCQGYGHMARDCTAAA